MYNLQFLILTTSKIINERGPKLINYTKIKNSEIFNYFEKKFSILSL